MLKCLRNRSQLNLLKFDISRNYNSNTAMVDEAGAVGVRSLLDRSEALKNLEVVGALLFYTDGVTILMPRLRKTNNMCFFVTV